ncbi:hypothetical protein COU13_01870 [Candidatus Kaiserbacteria bacterium CG10_big_fil_rev_8_21_14_0_10_43_70]|uniref:Uncharacterized protein n=1 Tax=Candidatus Kaiserbacteria bacterium CG10_big_fil_rev_8_21_14_0_10_43_70 TaxID=1974605 RepID=A0A2H0UIQ6_9BACT|nr:MAG: hypothetical protein COU13_01870 [Candidatus Kaiserbacteria bacterium CG10_big_fil_rev_8_21_14_0_10_43_70]
MFLKKRREKLKNKSFSYIGATGLISVPACIDANRTRTDEEAAMIAQGQLEHLAVVCMIFDTGEDPFDVRYAFESKADELGMSKKDPTLKSLYTHLQKKAGRAERQSAGTNGAASKIGTSISARNGKTGDMQPVENCNGTDYDKSGVRATGANDAEKMPEGYPV